MKCENAIGHSYVCTNEAAFRVVHTTPQTDIEPSFEDTFVVCEECVEEYRGLKLARIEPVDLKSQS